MALTRSSNGLAVIFVAVLGVMALTASAQVARFDSYQLEAVPENANIRLGAFSSDLAFFQSVGVRYVVSKGEGMDYLYGSSMNEAVVGGQPGSGVSRQSSSGSQLGRIKKDGLDFPLISQLTLRNYWLISKYMAVDFSCSLTYRAFPMGTEDNAFDVEIIDPGFYASMGSFTFGSTKDTWQGNYGAANMTAYSGSGGSGFSANIGTEFELTPFVRGRLYDRPSYRNEYLDPRGYRDSLSGQQYPVFQNILGMDLDWQMAADKSMGYSVARVDTVPQDNGYGLGRSVIYQQSLEYRQQLNPLTAVGVRGNWILRDYLDTRGSQDQKDCLAFMTTELTEDSTMNVELGYSMAELTGSGAFETNGSSDAVIGGIGLQTRLSESLSHGISYKRSQGAGFQVGLEVRDTVGYQIQWADPESWAVQVSSAYESVTPKLARVQPYTGWINQLTASRPLNRDLTMVLATAYTIRKNKTPASGDLGADNLFMSYNYDTWVTTIGFIQTLTEHFKWYTYAEHLERISPNPTLAGSREMVGTTLGYYYDF